MILLIISAIYFLDSAFYSHKSIENKQSLTNIGLFFFVLNFIFDKL
jgi:hypothetical protein